MWLRMDDVTSVGAVATLVGANTRGTGATFFLEETWIYMQIHNKVKLCLILQEVSLYTY